MLNCAQSGRVSGLVKKTDPANGARSNKKGLRDINNQLLGFVNKFCIPFSTKITIPICGGHDSDCTGVTHNRVAHLRVKHLNSDIEQTRRGIVFLVLVYILPVLILLFRFSVRKIV